MNRSRSIRLWLVGLGLGSLLLVAVLPATGWVARWQLGLVLWPWRDASWTWSAANPSGVPTLARARLRDVAARNQGDFGMQLAYALASSKPSTNGDEGARVVLPLVKKFPREPAAYATALRYATIKGLGRQSLDREWEISGDKPPVSAALRPGFLENARQIEKLAAAGGNVDPGNAFFPTMLALSLFSQDRPTEALEAIRRAGNGSVWEDYAWSEPKGMWRMTEAVSGNREAIARVIQSAAVLFPHLSRCRSVARAAAARAMEAEQARRIEDGLDIRLSVMRLGSLMRVQSTTLIGSLVGIAMTQVAMERPGGEPRLPKSTGNNSDKRREEVAKRFAAYLQSYNRESDARWVTAEVRAGKDVRSVAKTAFDKGLFALTPLVWLAGLWVVNISLLSNALSISVFAGLAAIAARAACVREKRPIPASVLWGVPFGLLAAVFLVTAWMDAALFALPFLAVIAVLGAGAAVLGKGRFTTIVSFAITTVLFGGAAMMQLSMGRGLVQQMNMLQNLFSESSASQGAQAFALIVLLAATLLPLLLAAGIAIWASIKRIPVSAGLVGALKSLAIPVACVLLFIYSLTVVGTARHEATMNANLVRVTTHEGRYMSEVGGTTWPGPVR